MPAVSRIGDAEIPHCSGMVRAQGSGNVFANGVSVSRAGDSNTVHLTPGNPCPAHSSTSAGSSTVFINGKGVSRVGDATCTAIAAGSSNVFAG